MAPKKKQEKMNLGEFLTNQSLGSWADEMETQPIPSASAYGSRDSDRGERRAFTQPTWDQARTGGGGVGGGMSSMGGRGASYGRTKLKSTLYAERPTDGAVDRPRFEGREQLPLPDKPPYTAHLGNLAYDVSRNEVEKLFEECQVTSVRIVEDKMDQKPKGFGYVEFATLEGLKKALTFTDTHFMGRSLKISVAEPPKDRAESTRDFSDWSRKGPLQDLPSSGRQPSRGFSRGGFDDRSDAGSERGGARKGFFEGDGKVRDFSNWERKGPLTPAPNNPPAREGGRMRETGGAMESKQAPAWGEGRSDSGSRPPRREFEPRPSVDRAPTAADQDTQWRSKMRPDASPAATPDVSTPSSPQQQAPKERPKLNLTKRQVSTGAEGAEAGAFSTDSKAATNSKASPFGAARPIDTAAREREIEEKHQMAIRQKKEADDKAKEDKVSRESAARAQRAERADRGQAQEDDKVTSPTSESGKARRTSRPQNGAKPAPKENGEAQAQNKPGFSILQHDNEEGDNEEEAVEDNEDANGEIVSEKGTQPQETKIEVSKAPNTNEPTAEAMEEEGWSTVSSSKLKSKGRGGGDRAIAS
ncbi:Eukaryotic translation initiation factor 4B [Vermiconidia calcicola]|uniref:Eukaryotic translation initiation factor 4B n=1 Tax=Vermiconidia calcicola TaxID=1690605 RepID=A0ACC3NRA1_9PEZI|nr:Eukaryotic translation initiation factor 4B [Vermiconidia calcicola]